MVFVLDQASFVHSANLPTLLDFSTVLSFIFVPTVSLWNKLPAPKLMMDYESWAIPNPKLDTFEILS